MAKLKTKLKIVLSVYQIQNALPWLLPSVSYPGAFEGLVNGMSFTVCKSTSASGAPDNSSLSHFPVTTRPSWLDRAVRNRHRHAIEQASRRWRGGGRERAVNFISTGIVSER